MIGVRTFGSFGRGDSDRERSTPLSPDVIDIVSVSEMRDFRRPKIPDGPVWSLVKNRAERFPIHLVARVQKRVLADLASDARQWSRCVRELNHWEDQHLLSTETAPTERLTEHKALVERLLLFGQVFAFATSHPEFADADTAGMVYATQQI